MDGLPIHHLMRQALVLYQITQAHIQYTFINNHGMYNECDHAIQMTAYLLRRALRHEAWNLISIH